MHENPSPSDDLVQMSGLMEPLGAEGKLGLVSAYGQKFSSAFRPDRSQKHWDNTLAYLNEAVRQVIRDSSPEKLDELLHDDDSSTLALFLIGMKLRLRYGSFTQDTMDSVFSMIRTHPARAVREAGLILLEGQNYLQPTPAVLRSREQKMGRDNLTQEGFDKWRVLRTVRWAVFDNNEQYTSESPLFDGQTRQWEFQNAYPIMALLWYAGNMRIEIEDLLHIDPNQGELTKDLTTLIKLGEVESVGIRDGLFGKKRTLFKLARSGFWTGPPW